MTTGERGIDHKMTGKLKIKQLAELTGLSQSTVSRVLAGKTNVSQLAKEKVFTHARAMGILRDIPASRLLMNTLLICAPAAAFTPHGDHYYYEVIQGIYSEVSRYDIHIKKCALEINDADVSLFMKAMAEADIDGIVIIGIDDDVLYRLASQTAKPIVTINAKDKHMRTDCVSPDHYAIGYSAANYLFGKGHFPVLLFTDLRRDTMMQRLDGFKRACQAHNVIFDEARHLLVTKGYGEQEARTHIEKYLEQRDRGELPSAILCGGGAIAQAVIKAVQSHGLKVPEDISVMSFVYAHDNKMAGGGELTAVNLPCRELGTEAVHILQSRLTREVSHVFNLLLQGTITPGETVSDVNWKRKALYQRHP